MRVWVHIADVAAFVKPGSALDREAFRRANSVYVPGLVEPMLPQALSNGACSLVPGRGPAGGHGRARVRGRERCAGPRSTARVIRSDVRLSTTRRSTRCSRAGDRVRPGSAAAARGSRRRWRRRASLAVESSEPEFAFSRDGSRESRWRRREQTESHRLIEHLMIAANEAVAGLLESRKLPALYRVHEPPDPARVERLLDQLASLDVPTPPAPEHLTAAQAGELVEEAAHAGPRPGVHAR